MTGQPGPRGVVVVGVDGSEPSKRALEWGAHVVAGTGSRLDAVIAWQLPAIGAEAGLLAGYDPEADARVTLAETIATVLGRTPSPPVRELVLAGFASRVLVEASAGAELLVLGSRGRGGLAGRLLGSTSAYCVQHARCPVLIVHADTPPPARP